MIKVKGLVLCAILVLILAGCSKTEQDQLTVYSFSGANEQLVISNGVIVLHGTEETFVGGNLEVADTLFTDVTSYSTTFYTMLDNEKNVILSNTTTDMRGDTINISSDLGQISGDTTISRIKISDTSDLKNSLYFELTTVNKTGEESVYQLQLSLTEIVNNVSN